MALWLWAGSTSAGGTSVADVELAGDMELRILGWGGHVAPGLVATPKYLLDG